MTEDINLKRKTPISLELVIFEYNSAEKVFQFKNVKKYIDFYSSDLERWMDVQTGGFFVASFTGLTRLYCIVHTSVFPDNSFTIS